LSRGAASCLFAENEAAAIRALRGNVANLRAQQACDVRAVSVMSLGPASTPYDLLLLDPPYGSGAGTVALDRLRRLGWIGEGTWIALETAHDEKVVVKGLAIESDRKVGKAKLTLLRLADPG
jgi:16S rRNA (guanine966-N2)-methyltransferase